MIKDTYICPVCGKDFCTLSAMNWAYYFYGKRKHKTFVCSYTCMRKKKH